MSNESETVTVTCRPKSPEVVDILDRLGDLEDHPQTIMNILTAAAVVLVESGADEGTMGLMTKAIEETFGGAGFPV